MKILIATELTTSQLEQVADAAGEAEVLVCRSAQDWLEAMSEVEVVFGAFDRDMFIGAEKLRWVHVLSAGVDGMLFPELVESDVILTSSKGIVGPHLADHAVALLLALIRGLHVAIRTKDWGMRMPIRNATWELEDKTVGIIGFGGTGREVAKRLQGFGPRMIALDAEPREPEHGVEAVWPPPRFHDLLAACDVVMICAPLTPETRGMIDRAAFRRMRPHALLINVTRGQIVDGEALMEALAEGRIGGAGLDVVPWEPLPSDHPLWQMPNVIITPHCAGGSPLRMPRTVDLFCENLRRFRAGEPLLAVVDKRKGY